MRKILIWDFNGTIIDDAHFCHRIETMMLEERGMNTYTFEQYQDMFCFPVINYYYKMGYTFENETYDDISVEFNDAYDKGFHKLHVMDDFHETIKKALSLGYENIILSASRQDKLLEQCEQLGISHYFTEILGTDNLYGGSKIDIAKDFMTRRKIDPSCCKFIGDSVHDMETANAVGINDVTLVARGHQSKDVLAEKCSSTASCLKEVIL